MWLQIPASLLSSSVFATGLECSLIISVPAAQTATANGGAVFVPQDEQNSTF